MGEVIPLQRPDNYAWIIRRIRKLWREGEVTWDSHLERALLKRKLLLADVRHIIDKGTIVGHSKPRSHWRYEIQGKLLDGGKATCIVEVNGLLVIVTCYVANRWP
jgi:hypothetical protein